MNQKHHSKYLMIFLISVVLILLGACSPASTPLPSSSTAVISTSTKTASPTITPGATATKIHRPTDTAIPAIVSTSLPGQTIADQYLERGQQHWNAGEYEKAIDAFNQAIVSYPWLYEAYYELSFARRLLMVKDSVATLDESIAQLDQAITQNPKDPEAYYKRGMAKLQKILTSGEPNVEETIGYENVTVVGELPVVVHLDMEEAVSDFDQAIEIDSRYAEAYHARGLASHLESLIYSGFALAQINEEGIRKAIKDYEKAIQLNPELASAHNDLGAAYTHLATGVPDVKQEEELEKLEQAIEEYSKAINSDPQTTRTYLNRAYVIYFLYGLLDYQKGSDNEKETRLMIGIDDTTKVIEAEPWNPWGYVLRGAISEQLSEVVKEGDNLTKWGNMAEEDYTKAEEVGQFLILQHHVTEWLSRLTTLSNGPPIFPEDAALVGRDYTSPDSNFRLEIPNLMSPNATMLVEQAESGDILVRFFDDIGRWFSLQVHPSSLGDQELEEWIQENLTPGLEISNVTRIDSKKGEAIEILYRDENRNADCGSAVQYYDQRFYTATYCLADEADANSGFRMFAGDYQIQYSPVDKVLEEYLQGLNILSE